MKKIEGIILTIVLAVFGLVIWACIINIPDKEVLTKTDTVKIVQKTINPKLRIRGFLPTMYSAQNNLSKQVFADLAQHFESKLFKIDENSYVVIPRNVKLAESPSFGKPIMLYDTASSGTKAYTNLARAIAG